MMTIVENKLIFIIFLPPCVLANTNQTLAPMLTDKTKHIATSTEISELSGSGVDFVMTKTKQWNNYGFIGQPPNSSWFRAENAMTRNVYMELGFPMPIVSPICGATDQPGCWVMGGDPTEKNLRAPLYRATGRASKTMAPCGISSKLKRCKSTWVI